MNDLTIIITSSFIQSHPSIKIIKKTIDSLKHIKIKEKTKIILAHDHSEEKKYQIYLKNLKEYLKGNKKKNIEIVIRDTHGHLMGNIRNAIKHVKTKYLLIMQHDLPFVKPIINNFSIYKVMEDMEINKEIKHLRFNKRGNVKKNHDAKNDLFGLQLKSKNFIYTRTPGWSDNNHLCLTSYYTDIVLKEVPDGIAMERILHHKITDDILTHSKYGTYLFGPINFKRMIRHIDGKYSK